MVDSELCGGRAHHSLIDGENVVGIWDVEFGEGLG